MPKGRIKLKMLRTFEGDESRGLPRQFPVPGALAGSVRAISLPTGYSSEVSGTSGSEFTMVNTFPLCTPCTSKRSLSTPTTRYFSAKTDMSIIPCYYDATLSPHDAQVFTSKGHNVPN